jgi:hypothetical protein
MQQINRHGGANGDQDTKYYGKEKLLLLKVPGK